MHIVRALFLALSAAASRAVPDARGGGACISGVPR